MVISISTTNPVVALAVSNWAAYHIALVSRPVTAPAVKQAPSVTAVTASGGSGGGRLDTYT